MLTKSLLFNSQFNFGFLFWISATLVADFNRMSKRGIGNGAKKFGRCILEALKLHCVSYRFFFQRGILRLTYFTQSDRNIFPAR